MTREKEGYREMLERLDEKYPGREFLTREELCELLGRCPTFVQIHWKQYWNKNLRGYSKVNIAKELVS